MATTTNYGWTTPNDSDPSKDGALAMRTLGNAIDSSLFSVASAAYPAAGYISGAYYQPLFGNSSSSTSMTNNVVYYRPFFVTATSTWDRIGFRSGSTYSVTGNVNVGIYNNSGGKPSTLLTSSNVTVAAANTNYEATISATMNKGWYWIAVQKTTGTFNATGTVNNAPYSTWDLPMINTTLSSSSGFYAWTETAGSPALPATAGTVTNYATSTIPHPYLRKA